MKTKNPFHFHSACVARRPPSSRCPGHGLHLSRPVKRRWRARCWQLRFHFCPLRPFPKREPNRLFRHQQRRRRGQRPLHHRARFWRRRFSTAPITGWTLSVRSNNTGPFSPSLSPRRPSPPAPYHDFRQHRQQSIPAHYPARPIERRHCKGRTTQLT